MECSFESCLGENLFQKSGLLKDNVYLKICFDVFGDVSSRTSLAEQPYLCHVFWNLPLTLIVVKSKLATANLCALLKLAFCMWTTPCGAIPKRNQITLTDLFLDCAQLVEGPPDLNSNIFKKQLKTKTFSPAPDQLLTLTYYILFCSILFYFILFKKTNYVYCARLTETCSFDGLIASIILLICKSLWIKASAKWLNVNVRFDLGKSNRQSMVSLIYYLFKSK